MVPQPDSNDGIRRERHPMLQKHNLAIIADDLTGACDAAIAFAGGIHPVRVELGSDLPSSGGVWAFNTRSRDVTPEEARANIQKIVAHLPAGQEVFKKIDSVFRGNTFLEIAAAIQSFPADLVIVAPAYPALGRQLLEGTLHIHDTSGHRTVAVANKLQEHGCKLRSLPTGMPQESLAMEIERGLSKGQKAFLCDAADQLDLTKAVQAARSLEKCVLWIGSGGLAHALADKPAHQSPEVELPQGDIVFFIGSDHTTTKGQVTHLRRVSGITETTCEHPAHPANGGLLLAIPYGRTLEEDIRHATSLVQPQQTGCLFMTGGDTALLVCSALGIHSLRLLRELDPGIPIGIAEGGTFDGVPVVLKSGGFGKRDVLRHVLDMFGRKETVPASWQHKQT